MFGINSQAMAQDNGAIDNYAQELPAGVDNLVASGLPPTNSDQPLPQPPQDNVAQAVQNDQQATDQLNLSSNDDLINIKKDALQQLTPLVGHLDQTPEEKFRTTMMLIQATDDKSLLRSAYESALQIPDEKSKAQALLDVVNEINYFTHPDAQ
jgi:LPS O-antigen subunit length determinant protein (WzzB/FepE family)